VDFNSSENHTCYFIPTNYNIIPFFWKQILLNLRIYFSIRVIRVPIGIYRCRLSRNQISAQALLKPTEIVFPWIAEPEKAMKWQKNVKDGEILINKPEIIGTTFKEIIEEDGNSLEMYGTITKYIKNNIIGFHLESKIHEFDVSYSVIDINKKTKITIEATIKWKFPLNVISLFIGKKMKDGLIKQLDSEIFDLKNICEAE